MKNLFHSRNDWFWGLLIGLCSFAFFCSDINGWQFGPVGDELAYFKFASKLSQNNFAANPFGLKGVYGLERVMGSFWQGLWIKSFGENIVAWRLSNGFCLIPITLLTFFTTRRLFGRKTAFFGAVLTAAAPVLLLFFKIGYTHPLCLTAYMACFYASVRVLQEGERRDFLWLGALLGLSFYFYLGPIFLLVFAPSIWLAGLQDRHKSQKDDTKYKSAVGNWTLVVLLAISIASIGFFTTPSHHWFAGTGKTSLNSTELPNKLAILTNIKHNFFLWFKDWDYAHRHYIIGGYLNWEVRLFAVAGLANCLMKWRQRESRLLLSVWFFTCLVLGAINPYPYTPSTRALMFIPCGEIFAAVGLRWGAELLMRGGRNRMVQQETPLRPRLFKDNTTSVAVVVLSSIVMLSLWRSSFVTFLRTGHGPVTLLWAYARRNPQGATVFVTPGTTFNVRAVLAWGQVTGYGGRLRIEKDDRKLLALVDEGRAGTILIFDPRFLKPQLSLELRRRGVKFEKIQPFRRDCDLPLSVPWNRR